MSADDLIDLMAEAMWLSDPGSKTPGWAACAGFVRHRYLRRACAALAAIKASGYELVKPELGKLSADWLAQAQRFPECTRKFALDLINATPDGARFAVVELPAPSEPEPGDEFTDFPGVGLYVPVVFDAHPGEVQIRAGAWCDEPLSVAEAEEFAASVLAAARLAAVADEKAGQ